MTTVIKHNYVLKTT